MNATCKLASAPVHWADRKHWLVALKRFVGRMAPARHRSGTEMTEFLKSSAIVLMGLTVIGAGVFVAFYG
jgi:hypothetical protein